MQWEINNTAFSREKKNKRAFKFVIVYKKIKSLSEILGHTTIT